MNSLTMHAVEIPASPYRAVAPAWHTAMVLFALLGFSLTGALGLDRMLARQPQARVMTYLFTIVVEWALVAFIWHAANRRGIGMVDLVGGSWPRAKDILRDLGIALGFLAASSAILNGIGYFLKTSNSEALRKALPHSPLEIGVWILLSLTAGFCEELIFRGYLLRQFTAVTRSVVAGIILQGIGFGLAHGYQGWKFMLLISLFGVMFGLLAQWRRSLRPGMMAHFLQDGVAGIVAGFFMR